MNTPKPDFLMHEIKNLLNELNKKILLEKSYENLLNACFLARDALIEIYAEETSKEKIEWLQKALVLLEAAIDEAKKIK